MSDTKRSIRVATGQHRQYLLSLARMTPEQRLAKAFELSALTKADLKQALRDRFRQSRRESVEMQEVEGELTVATRSRQRSDAMVRS